MIFQALIIWFNRIHSLKYLRYATFGSKDIVIRKSDFVAKTQFLLKLKGQSKILINLTLISVCTPEVGWVERWELNLDICLYSRSRLGRKMRTVELLDTRNLEQGWKPRTKYSAPVRNNLHNFFAKILHSECFCRGINCWIQWL